MNYSINFV